MGRNAYGDWSRYRVLPHINVLEFQAVILSLHHFLPLVRHRTVLIRTDIVTVAAYIYKQTRGHSLRTPERPSGGAVDLVQAQGYYPNCLIHPRPGQYNCRFSIPRPRLLSEWTLHPQVMAMILRTFGPLHMDLFASVLNAQLRRYCTKTLDPAVWRLDAFSFRWEGFTGYAFPPISIIPRILQKVRQDRATILLIAPWWPKRMWFLDMTTPVVGYPRILSAHRDMISQPISGTLHPRPAALHLTDWPLSGRPELRQAFLIGLRPSLPAAVGNQPGRHSIPVLQDFSVGANHTGCFDFFDRSF